MSFGSYLDSSWNCLDATDPPNQLGVAWVGKQLAADVAAGLCAMLCAACRLSTAIAVAIMFVSVSNCVIIGGGLLSYSLQHVCGMPLVECPCLFAPSAIHLRK